MPCGAHRSQWVKWWIYIHCHIRDAEDHSYVKISFSKCRNTHHKDEIFCETILHVILIQGIPVAWKTLYWNLALITATISAWFIFCHPEMSSTLQFTKDTEKKSLWQLTVPVYFNKKDHFHLIQRCCSSGHWFILASCLWKAPISVILLVESCLQFMDHSLPLCGSPCCVDRPH